MTNKICLHEAIPPVLFPHVVRARSADCMATVGDWLLGMTQVIDVVTRAVRGSGRSSLLVVCG